MPVPINEYTTATPGTILQGILTQRAHEKRQAMLDQIEGQYKQAQMQNMQSEADYRKQQAGFEQQKMNMEQQKFAQAQAGSMMPGPITPEQGKIAETGFPGSTETKPGEPEVNPQEGQPGFGVLEPRPATPATLMFKGTPQHQRQIGVQKSINDFMNSSEYGTMSDEQKLMKIMSTPGIDDKDLGPYERILAAKIAANVKEEQVPYYDVDRQGKPVMVGMVPKNSIFKQQPAPERETYDYLEDGQGGYVKMPKHGGPPQQVNMPQPAQKPVTSPGTFMKDPSTGRSVSVPIDQVNDKQTAGWSFSSPEPTKYFRIGTEPKSSATKTGATKTPALYDDKILARYQAALKNGTDAQRTSLQADLINSVSDPAIKQDLVDAQRDAKKSGKNFSEALSRISPPPGPPEQQKAYMDKVNAIASVLVSQ